jgi:general secretion pathway protein H
MPKWAPGSKRRAAGRGHLARVRRAAGFTLIELMIVVALIALTSGLVTLALRDPAASHLEIEAQRLIALLEAARSEARASGLPVRWVAGRDADASADTGDFRFVGLPRRRDPSDALPDRWLDAGVTAEIVGARAVTLGPEPLIGAQRIVLRLDDKRLALATDGLGPFTVAPEAGAEPAQARP